MVELQECTTSDEKPHADVPQWHHQTFHVEVLRIPRLQKMSRPAEKHLLCVAGDVSLEHGLRRPHVLELADVRTALAGGLLGQLTLGTCRRAAAMTTHSSALTTSSPAPFAALFLLTLGAAIVAGWHLLAAATTASSNTLNHEYLQRLGMRHGRAHALCSAGPPPEPGPSQGVLVDGGDEPATFWRTLEHVPANDRVDTLDLHHCVHAARPSVDGLDGLQCTADDLGIAEMMPPETIHPQACLLHAPEEDPPMIRHGHDVLPTDRNLGDGG
mmetsp:Transcript_104543/g.294581  ORF Transcript_104543/g.294581 Transcript_104543/m.294581 type:complete len:271 (+) Transcript_104543:686-1498(+)